MLMKKHLKLTKGIKNKILLMFEPISLPKSITNSDSASQKILEELVSLEEVDLVSFGLEFIDPPKEK